MENSAKGNRCCFIGHRTLEVTDELISRLKQEIEILILSGVTHFLFGTRSEFNSLCHKIVSDLKQSYPQIVRIAYTTFHECVVLQNEVEKYERMMTRFWKRDVHLEGYEEEITSEALRKSGRATYVERNQTMIDDSDFCIFYYDENYRPQRRELSHKYSNKVLSSAQSGTALAFRYALSKNKRIINVF